MVGSLGGFYPTAGLLLEPHAAAYVAALARHVRLLLLDRRGLGYSDPFGADEQAPTLLEQGQDVLAVLDDAGVERAALHGGGFDGQAVLQLAADRPDRVSACVLGSATPRLAPGPDWPHGADRDLLDRWRRSLDAGGEPFDMLAVVAPSRRDDHAYRGWFTSVGQSSARPATARAYVLAAMETDVRAAVPEVQARCLVIHTRGNRLVPVGAAHWLRDHLRDAEYEELPGDDAVLWLGRGTELGHRVAEFVLQQPLSRERSSTGWESLTAAQAAVAQLVAEGLTNAQVARRLGISARTVESHLAQVFQRLDVGSRSEVTAAVVRRDPRAW